MRVLNRHAPLKEKYVCANNSHFMNKTLSKAMMTRTRLRNNFLKIIMRKRESNIPNIEIIVQVSLEKVRNLIIKTWM